MTPCAQGQLIVQAPAGLDKSAQILRMLPRHGFLDGGEIVVLQPGRPAKHHASLRMLASPQPGGLSCLPGRVATARSA